MHLIGYKAYRSGYFGCLADKDRYIYFLFAKQALSGDRDVSERRF